MFCKECYSHSYVLWIGIALAPFLLTCATQQTPLRSFHVSPTANLPNYPMQPVISEPVVQLSRYKNVQERPGQNPQLALAVAISGGGHRAGNLGLGALAALEDVQIGDRHYNVLREVDYFSTISGGSLAAAAYLSCLYDYMEITGSPQGYSLRQALAGGETEVQSDTWPLYDPEWRQYAQHNYHKYLFQGLITFLSFGSIDRGDFLERAFDQKVLGREWRGKRLKAEKKTLEDATLTLGDVFIRPTSQRPVRLPYWFANATVFENGAIFPFTPDILEQYRVIGYSHNLETVHLNPSDPDYDSVPLSVGLKASATFPVAVPATTLSSDYDPNNPYLHLYDGGMSDNTGVITAIRLLVQDPAPRKVLLVIDAFNGSQHPFSVKSTSPTIPQFLWHWTKEIPLTSNHLRYREMPGWISLQYGEDEGHSLDMLYLDFDLDLDDQAFRGYVDESGGQYTSQDYQALAPKEQAVFPPNAITRNPMVDTLTKPPLFAAGLLRTTLQPLMDLTPFSVLLQARSVSTTFSITEEQQECLLEAGQMMVAWATHQGGMDHLAQWISSEGGPE